jgi:hypothetical protein
MYAVIMTVEYGVLSRMQCKFGVELGAKREKKNSPQNVCCDMPYYIPKQDACPYSRAPPQKHQPEELFL